MIAPSQWQYRLMRCLPKGARCLFSTGGKANCLCQQEPYRHRDQVCKHRKGTPCHCICLPEIQHVRAWEAVHSWEQPQATGNDTPEEPCKHPSQTTVYVASTSEIWSHYQVQARKGHAAHRCIEQVLQPWIWGNQAGHACRLCCL